MGSGNPNLLPVDDVSISLPYRVRFELSRVGAGGWFRDPECLVANFSRRDPWQVAALLLFVSVTEQQPHHIHLRVASGGVAAGGVNLLQDGAAAAHRQTGTAKLLGNQGRQISCLSHLLNELFWIPILG